MPWAAIDIGSNTTRLLVAAVEHGRLVAIAERRAFTRIGSDVRRSGRIGPLKIAEVVTVATGFFAEARALGVAQPRVIGTAAIRAAADREELRAALEATTGARLEVIDGEHEARLAFLGATRTLPEPPQGVVGVVDVGGGSTEIAVGTLAGGVAWSVSLPLGSGLLTDAHSRSDPISAAELAGMRDHAARVLSDITPPAVERGVAVGGSATSLCRLVGTCLEPASTERGIVKLTSHPAAEIAARFALDAQRVALLPAGLVILDAVAARLGVGLRVGHGGVREGVCLECADG